MADQEREQRGTEYITEPKQDVITVRDARDEIYQEETAEEIAAPARDEHFYREETAAEIAAPAPLVRRGSDEETETGGRGLAYSALALSILSLFILPVLFGAAGIILGFMARRRGSAIGSWAIGIGVISILIGIFILPFF
ncbi:DUF4190 domain-containing protein [Bacillus sp. JJ1122]|uniref:DUF4190 domain-containing protein n=1 Tax=Bacillus sp. JJ1122 TaxID=3122951 RepID=UPI002FFFB89D